MGIVPRQLGGAQLSTLAWVMSHANALMMNAMSSHADPAQRIGDAKFSPQNQKAETARRTAEIIKKPVFLKMSRVIGNDQRTPVTRQNGPISFRNAHETVVAAGWLTSHQRCTCGHGPPCGWFGQTEEPWCVPSGILLNPTTAQRWIR